MFAKKVFQLSKKAVIALGISAFSVVTAAHAALPASVATTVAEIEADGQAMFDLIFPVIAALVGLSIVIKLFKRFSNKA